MYRILLVEDELLVRTGMRTLVDWSAHGYELAAEAIHGQEALEILEQQEIDIVITDIRMPVMDGLKLIQHMKERNYACSIIVLSSYDDFPYVKAAMKFGVKDYIHKPTMTPDELTDSLNKVKEEMQQSQTLIHYEEIIKETMEESQGVLMAKAVRLSLSGKRIDEKSMQMLNHFFLLKDPFYLGLLRCVDASQLGLDESAAYLQEKCIQSYMERTKQSSSRSIFYMKEGEDWLILWSAHTKFSLQELQAEMSQTQMESIAHTAKVPCRFAQLREVYMECCEAHHQAIRRWKEERQYPILIREAMNYIHEHYMDNLTLEKVSESIHVSPAYISRLFYKETGSTFIDYVTKYRMEKAKQLLLRTELRTYEVAEKVGYKNSKYFLKVFKRWVGTTPGEYRAQRAGTK